MAAEEQRKYIALVGTLPPEAPAASLGYFGVYEVCAQVVNGMPTYERLDDPWKGGNACRIWYMPDPEMGLGCWRVGIASHVGKGRGAAIRMNCDTKGALCIDRATGRWEAWDGARGWLAAPAIQVLGSPAPLEEVEVTGERTPEQKDAELRKRAVDLENDHERPRKRCRAQAAQLKERVAAVRSRTDAAIELRMHELLKNDFQEFIGSKIDAAELDRRKQEVRQIASATIPARQRTMDNHVAEAHSAAVAAREAAETDHQRSYTALVEAEEQEDATEAAVMKALARLEPGPGPSGAVKTESPR
eukprot:scaffold732_cov60-Phaeocystis_antarctica.AAC.3